MPDDLLGKSPSRRKGVVAEEPDDLGEVAQLWLCPLPFPVVDSCLVYPELLSHLELEQAKVEPTLAKVVTDCK